MNYSLELKIPFLPKAFNVTKRMNPFKFNEYNKSWYELIALYTSGKRPEIPLNKVKLTCHRYSSTMMDYDGLVSSFKAPVDGLERSKIIKKDSWKVTNKWDVDQFFIKKKELGYILIKVESIGE